MKLRNKKTGEIVETDYELSISIPDDEKFYGCNTYNQIKGYNSIKDFTDHWEDAPEEPKNYWCVTGRGNLHYLQDITDENDKDHKEIGNYFETKEEAEKAVEKLKAWKRLKDKGFRFDGWDENHHNLGIIEFSFDRVENNVWDFEKDLDLIFGGKE